MKIEIPEELSPDQRIQLADDIIEYIVDRTKKGADKRNRPFPGYSKSYIDSLDFKIAGKSRSRIDLTLSGEMLADLTLLSHRKGQLLIGFENGTESNAKADGNIRGTYGQSFSTGKKRDFLGITKGDLFSILDPYLDGDFRTGDDEENLEDEDDDGDE